MGIQTDSVTRVLTELRDKGSINQAQYDALYSKYARVDGELVSTSFPNYNERTSSKEINTYAIEAAIDLVHVYGLLDNINEKITSKINLDESASKSIMLQSCKAYDNLKRSERKLSNKTAFVSYEAFRDFSNTADDLENVYEEVMFDKYLEAIKLNPDSSVNVLISTLGERTGRISILKQYASEFSAIKNSNSDINNAIDNSRSTYWHECITVDTPISIPFTTSVTNISNGAICEILISLDALSEINEINLSPFVEYPLEVVEISYSPNETDDYSNFTPLVFKPNTVHPTNKYMENKISGNTIMYQFDNISASRIKIALNQIHYSPTSFISSVDNLRANGLFVSQDNTDLINAIIEPLKDAIVNETLSINTDRLIIESNKLQYEYGLYNISILNNIYDTVSEYVSAPLLFPGLSTITLQTNEEHYIYNNIQTTSIEYYFLFKGETMGLIPILPIGSTHSQWELLSPIQDTFTNKITANLRFTADKSNISDNIALYRDNVRIYTGFVFNSPTQVEFVEFDPKAKYVITYKLNDPDLATHYKIPTETEIIELMDIRLRAILRQNSRSHTGVTPILYDYTVIPTDVPIPVGGRNSLSELKIIPHTSNTRVLTEIPIRLSSVPVLMEITIPQNPVCIDEDTLCEVDEYIVR